METLRLGTFFWLQVLRELFFFLNFSGRTQCDFLYFLGGVFVVCARKCLGIDGLFWLENLRFWRSYLFSCLISCWFYQGDISVFLEKQFRLHILNFEFWAFVQRYAGKIKSRCFSGGKYFRYRHCYPSRHTSRGDKISSTCSLPDEQYVHVIYGGMGHDSRLYEY